MRKNEDSKKQKKRKILIALFCISIIILTICVGNNIIHMQKAINEKSNTINDLQSTVGDLTNTINAKNSIIESLNSIVAQKDTSVINLTNTIAEKNALISTLTERLDNSSMQKLLTSLQSGLSAIGKEQIDGVYILNINYTGNISADILLLNTLERCNITIILSAAWPVSTFYGPYSFNYQMDSYSFALYNVTGNFGTWNAQPQIAVQVAR